MGLKSVGIKAADVDRLSEDAMKQSRLLVNNPREVTLSDIKTIYQEAL
jgi:alcohol dehydrogenase class IV